MRLIYGRKGHCNEDVIYKQIYLFMMKIRDALSL